MNDETIYKRISITLHPEEIRQLSELCNWWDETKSGMIRRLINFKYIAEERLHQQQK